ncbi:MAG: hypothetical protein ACR2PT_13785 [Endozoicomonas sp.]
MNLVNTEVLKVILLLTSAITLLAGCNPPKELKAPEPPAVVQPTPDNWPAYQQEQKSRKTRYIQEKQIAYDWFADFSFSNTDGTPYILLKLLPVIAPEYWGSEENFLSSVGLFMDDRQGNYPVARGIGISALARGSDLSNIDYASFTCAACHIGRVAKPGGAIEYIDGGVNTEFNIVKYRVSVYKTLQKVFGDETSPEKRQQLVIDAFLSALEKTHNSNKTYFYGNFANWNAEYEKNQIELFTQTAAKTISQFTTRAIGEYNAYGALLDKNYNGFQKRSLQGFPGMADATGISASNGYAELKKGTITRYFASLALPTSPGITDFMSVWEQDKRRASWDDSHQTLINGGGQWNGNIPIPMYRNLAAQLTLGLKNNDIRVSAFAVDLLDGLPASVYPFDVDITLAKKGEVLFRDNCAQCHQPHNGKVYTILNTDLDRSYVVNWLIRYAGIRSFLSACSPETTVVMGNGKQKPCAEFDGVSLNGKKDIIMSPNATHHGYNARPLSGIWAQAPYLHNGSVPTIYHLLVPGERPSRFIKSRLSYDEELLGFDWNSDGFSSEHEPSGYVFDTNSFRSLSNKGHDQDITEDGITYKLDWSDDPDGANAIIEYLKTL